MVVKFICEYNGKNFCGFQRQRNGRSVQGELESALSQYLGADISISGSGRTDAGVHARGQVCSFEHNILCGTRDVLHKILWRIQQGTNAILSKPPACKCGENALHPICLPPDIVVRDFTVAPDGFNARTWTKQKTYLYRVYVGQQSPLRDELYHNIYAMPDVVAMREFAARNFVGTHDFAAYSAQNAKADTTRTISDFPIEVRTPRGTVVGGGTASTRAADGGTVPGGVVPDTDADEIWFWVTGDGFLRRMVRLLVGELLAVGARATPAGEIGGCGRVGHRVAAPAKGLTLWSVEY